jgi:hypothetical protein
VIEDGQTKRGCLRCRWLDGYDTYEYRIVAALREAECAVSLQELAKISGLSERALYREPMRRLIARGRVATTMSALDGHAGDQGHARRHFRLVEDERNAA